MGDRTVAQSSATSTPQPAQSFSYDQDGRLITVQDTYGWLGTKQRMSMVGGIISSELWARASQIYRLVDRYHRGLYIRVYYWGEFSIFHQ